MARPFQFNVLKADKLKPHLKDFKNYAKYIPKK